MRSHRDSVAVVYAGLSRVAPGFIAGGINAALCGMLGYYQNPIKH